MRTRLTTITLMALLAVFAGAPLANAGGSGWLTSWEKAVKKAKKVEKPILLEFCKSDSSEDCKKMTKEIFRQSAFRSWAKKNVVLMTADFPERKSLPERIATQNAELAEKFEVDSFRPSCSSPRRGRSSAATATSRAAQRRGSRR